MPAVLTHIDCLGVPRQLGCKRTPPVVQTMLGYAPVVEDLIPESEWEEFNEFPDEVKRKDQGTSGACNGHEIATTCELTRYASNQLYIALSAWFIYGNLVGPGGPDVGSSIGEGRVLIGNKGICPEVDLPYGKFDPDHFTKESYDDALRYVTYSSEMVTSELALMSHIQRRRACGVAIPVGDKFDQLDNDGIAVLDFYRACNHAVTVGFGAKRGSDGLWLILMTNSWSEAWGLKGQCWLRLAGLSRTRYFEAYVNLGLITDPQATDWDSRRVA